MSRLVGCLPRLRTMEEALQVYAAHMGIQYVIHEGFPNFAGLRTRENVALLISWRDKAVRDHGAKAYYPVSPFDKGKHGVGGAFDVEVISAGYHTIGSATPRTKDEAYNLLGAEWQRLGGTWGGSWAGRGCDPYHMELADSRTVLAEKFDQLKAGVLV